MRFFPTTAILLSILLALPAAHAGFKKWVDENGVVHYGTSIPPEYVDRGHTELNQRGIAVERVDRAKTAEEIAREQELAELRAAQKKVLQEQQARDRVLLSMYRTEDDLIMERNGKLAQVDSHITLKQKQVERLKQRLAKWQAAAADAERRGGKLSRKQQENLDATQRQIESAYASIVEKQSDRERIEARYQRDLTRLRQLRSTRSSRAPALAETPAASASPVIDSAFVCSSSTQCDRLWPVAKDYARAQASTPVQVEGKSVLMTSSATAPEDVSITVSRIGRDDGERLFIDVQCQDSLRGRDLCASERVQAIRNNFRGHLQQAAQRR